MLSFWCNFHLQKCPSPHPPDIHCLFKYACICYFIDTEMLRVSIITFPRQAFGRKVRVIRRGLLVEY